MPLTLAPYFGGLWEAAVKSAKGLLNRTLANTRFTFEELSTVVVEIESILNSRPLSPLSSDPNDYSTLTAGHLLVGESLRSLPERSLENIKLSSSTNCDRARSGQHPQRTSPRARWSSSMRTTCHRYAGN
ncbi:uncharacterized protein [Drosophila pseudoobscura]|uniref:Integrase catalytic domain-containing protein n=1 Tax=Drosophila pseudoobscura pseudoobscura TaxID=46245 RepID=A0A6I8W936_DROPS|nr:uncharacterized protein LOC117184889 [Drosophila pseudoobscura]